MDHKARHQTGRTRLVTLAVLLSASVAALGAVGAVFLLRTTNQFNSDLVRAQFDASSNAVIEVLSQAMANSAVILGILNTTMALNPDISFGEFMEVAASVNQVVRLQSVQWEPHVLADERASWEQRVSAYVGENMTITALTPNGSLVVAPSAPDYYPVGYAYPLAGNERALLFNDESSPERFAPLQQAIETGQPVLSGPISLVQDEGLPGSPLGNLLFLPTYVLVFLSVGGGGAEDAGPDRDGGRF